MTVIETKECELRLIKVRQEAVIPGRTTTILVFASALFGFAGGILLHTQSAEQPNSAGEPGRLLAAGKEIFLERCASCHNEGWRQTAQNRRTLERARTFHGSDRTRP